MNVFFCDWIQKYNQTLLNLFFSLGWSCLQAINQIIINMRNHSFREKEILFILKQVENGADVKDVCAIMEIPLATYYSWRKRIYNCDKLSRKEKNKLLHENFKLKKQMSELQSEKAQLLRELRRLGLI